MELAIYFPSGELGMDPVKIRDFIQGAEQLGYTRVHGGEHVVGADATHRPDWNRPYTLDRFTHEPLTLMTFLAAHTQRMLLVPAVLIVAMRQTVLVAKQAAAVDGFSGGRLRLGLGIGTNPVEYEVMGEDYHTRGRRMEEQVAVLRELWTKPSVTFEGRWHHLFEVGINPLPVQRPIPLWMGGGAVERVLKRIGRLSDGWIVTSTQVEGGFGAAIERYKAYAKEAGRDPAMLDITGRIEMGSNSPDQWRKEYEAWEAWGANAVVVQTSNAGTTPDQQLDAFRRFKEAVS